VMVSFMATPCRAAARAAPWVLRMVAGDTCAVNLEYLASRPIPGINPGFSLGKRHQVRIRRV
jgi:hypothetical protein